MYLPAPQRLRRHPTARQRVMSCGTTRTVPENTVEVSILPQITSSLQSHKKWVFHLYISKLGCLIQTIISARLDLILSSCPSEYAGKAGRDLKVCHTGVHSGFCNNQAMCDEREESHLQMCCHPDLKCLI